MENSVKVQHFHTVVFKKWHPYMGEFVKSGHVEPSICVMCFAHKDTCDQFYIGCLDLHTGYQNEIRYMERRYFGILSRKLEAQSSQFYEFTVIYMIGSLENM